MSYVPNTKMHTANVVHSKSVYAGLEDYVLSAAAADASLALGKPGESLINASEFSAEKLADLLAACGCALRKRQHNAGQISWGKKMASLVAQFTVDLPQGLVRSRTRCRGGGNGTQPR